MPDEIPCSVKKFRLAIGESGTYYLIDQSTSMRFDLDKYMESCCKQSISSKPKDCFSFSFDILEPKKLELKKISIPLDASLDMQVAYKDYAITTVADQTVLVSAHPYDTATEITQDTYDPSIISANVIAILAVVFTAASTINKKKKEAESTKCCMDSRTQIESLKIKLEKLEQQYTSATENSSKAIYAEMYEHYKELKELKEDSSALKDVVSKLIERA